MARCQRAAGRSSHTLRHQLAGDERQESGREGDNRPRDPRLCRKAAAAFLISEDAVRGLQLEGFLLQWRTNTADPVPSS
jgi:hypothetical protein